MARQCFLHDHSPEHGTQRLRLHERRCLWHRIQGHQPSMHALGTVLGSRHLPPLVAALREGVVQRTTTDKADVNFPFIQERSVRLLPMAQ